MSQSYETKEFDVLVIGAGGAGLRAAIEAYEQGAKVIVTSKSLLGKAHTVMAEGGISAAIGNVDPKDSWEVHFSDTIREGQFLSNWRIAEIFAKEAPEVVYELEHWGALFDRTPEGKIMQRPFGAHTYRRLCHIGDRTGMEMIRTLEDEVLYREIPVLDEVMMTSLLKDRTGHVSGAMGFQIDKGEFFVVKAKAVILATGGCGKLYKITSNSWESTGDGLALAYRAGAQIMDMEMIQFHPTGMVWPPGVRGLLITEAVRGEGGILLNSKGERFMSKYSPKKMELSARDVVARACNQEILEGRGTPHGGVYLDISHKGAEFIKKKLPGMYAQFRDFAGVDITKEKMEVAPTVHYQMGGVRVNSETGEATIKGLYAAGEVAGGLHGANRLGGNSLSDILVFGRRAGRAAGKYVKDAPEFEIHEHDIKNEVERVLQPFHTKGGENPFKIKDELQETMARHVGIIRDGKELELALSQIEQLKHRTKNISVKGGRAYNPGWTTAIDVQNMLIVAESIIRSAIMRKESRGAHTRSDYPNKDDSNWKVNILVTLKDGHMHLHTEPVSSMPPEHAKLLEKE